MKPIDRLNAAAWQHSRERYPDFPEYARVIEKYSDKTANGLTKCIIHWIKFNAGQAERISVTGRYVDTSKMITDVVGRTRKIGSGKYIPSTMQTGSADISAIIRGRSVKIEVKIGSDRQSEAQRAYQEQVEKAGGVYIIAKTFEDFLNWYDGFVGNP
jgi:hypothetical protein